MLRNLDIPPWGPQRQVVDLVHLPQVNPERNLRERRRSQRNLKRSERALQGLGQGQNLRNERREKNLLQILMKR